MLRFLTAGESHGPSLTLILEGIPAHVRIAQADLQIELARRRLGAGRGARMKFELDELRILGGIRHGVTLGSPIAVEIGNTEWPKWQKVMSADPVPEAELESLGRNQPLTRPRPGHADLAGMQKYRQSDAREILERASARETAARVAAGACAKAFLDQVFNIRVWSHVVELGPVSSDGSIPNYADLSTIDADPVRCYDPAASARMQKEIADCHKEGDTIGGVVEVLADNLPPGLGNHIQWDLRLDTKLAAALMSIQAIKGVEMGDGFNLARSRGSKAHDEIVLEEGTIRRATDRSGGVEGGMTTGEMLRVRAAMKPIATVPRALRTVDTASGEPAVAHHQRSDVCAVPAAAVVAESMCALTLADVALEKFGGDSVEECRRNYDSYRSDLRKRGLGTW